MSKLVTNIKEILSVTGVSDTVVPQKITASWVKVGSVGNPMAVGSFDELVVRPVIVRNDAENMRFRIIERITSLTGGSEYTPEIETESATVVQLDDLYKELNVDINQNPIVRFDVSGLKFIEIQTQAGTAGTSGASITSCKYNLVQNY